MKARILFFLLLVSIINFAQNIYTPLDNGVYLFLERFAGKKIIYVDNEVKPWTRKEISGYLEQVKLRENQLNNTEKSLLNYYLSEFEEKASTLNFLPVRYADSKFSLTGNVIAGLEYNKFGDVDSWKRIGGISFYGSYDNWFNAYIRFTDSGETGDYVDDERNVSPERGYDFFNVDNGVEYSDIIGGLVLDFEWGNLKIAKDYQLWGSGRNGQLILSDKPASYPSVSLTLKPVEWFRFYYMHGWLNSGVIDSSTIRRSNSSEISSPDSYSFIPKYIAANMLTLSYDKLFDFSIGNSIVYQGDLRAEMFVPFMFFKYLDRDAGKGNVNDGNGQIFFDFSLYYPENYNFYATLFFDVLSLKSITGDFRHARWLGYTVGAKRFGIFNTNIDLFLEYTRISPWVYEHKDDVTTYKHLGYTLGHWIGQNADLISFGINYYPHEKVFLSLKGDFLRKGGLTDIYYAYNGGEDEEFLYGGNRSNTRLELSVRYRVLPFLYLTGKGGYSDVSDEVAGRTPDYMMGSNNFFSIGFIYGI